MSWAHVARCVALLGAGGAGRAGGGGNSKLYLALKIRSLVHCIFNYILTFSHIQLEDLLDFNAILFQELSLSLAYGAADKRAHTYTGIRQRLPQLISKSGEAQAQRRLSQERVNISFNVLSTARSVCLSLSRPLSITHSLYVFVSIALA